MNISQRDARTALQPDHGKHAFFLCQRGQTSASSNPLPSGHSAIDSLPALMRQRQFEVIRHFHVIATNIDGSTIHQIVVIVERQRHAK